MLESWPFLSVQCEIWKDDGYAVEVERLHVADQAFFCEAIFPVGYTAHRKGRDQMSVFSQILMIRNGSACIESDSIPIRYVHSGEWMLLADLDMRAKIKFIQTSDVAWFELGREVWSKIEVRNNFPLCHKTCVGCIRRTQSLFANGNLSGRSRLLLEKLARPETCDFSIALKRSALIHELLGIALEAPEFYLENSTRCCFRKTDRDLLERIACYLEHNLHLSHSLRELSETFSVSETKLKRGFKSTYQTTVFGFLREKRMQHALEQLTTTDETVLEIAYAVGYSNPSQFTKAFRDFHGKNPSDFRRSLSSALL